MFYGWDMTSNVSTGKVAIQSAAMKIAFNQFLATLPLPHSIYSSSCLLVYMGRESSEPRSEHTGEFMLFGVVTIA